MKTMMKNDDKIQNTENLVKQYLRFDALLFLIYTFYPTGFSKNEMLNDCFFTF